MFFNVSYLSENKLNSFDNHIYLIAENAGAQCKNKYKFINYIILIQNIIIIMSILTIKADITFVVRQIPNRKNVRKIFREHSKISEYPLNLL